MKFLFTTTLIIISISIAVGQNNSATDSTMNKAKVIQDYRIEKLNETYKSSFKLSGYRIQIYSGNKKQPARDARLKFTQHFKDVKAHETYQQPYFKVRVGDFKTKLEALKFQKELSNYFPNCFIVVDEIEFKN